MKTTIYFSALLALIIQVMVKDQTPVAQVISHNTVNSASNKKTINGNDPDVRKFYPVIHRSTAKVQDQRSNRHSVSNSAELNQIAATTQQSGSLNSISYSNASLRFEELQQQAKDFSAKSAKLRLAAKNSEGLVRTELNNEANELYKLYEQRQIESSELWAKMVYSKYAQNVEKFNSMINIFKGSNAISDNARNLEQEAERFIKLAREMREEAYAMPTNGGKLGTMTNAEEKETLALNDQERALDMIRNHSINNTSAGEFVFAPYIPKTESLNDLLADADDLNAKSQKLSVASRSEKNLTKSELILEANYLYILSELKQIAASELSAKISSDKFNKNELAFNNLVKSYAGTKTTAVAAKSLITEAERCMKLAKEMREEAYAMPTIAAKLGSMSNAEEKEALALNKEDKAIELVKRSSPNVNFNSGVEMMANVYSHTNK